MAISPSGSLGRKPTRAVQFVHHMASKAGAHRLEGVALQPERKSCRGGVQGRNLFMKLGVEGENGAHLRVRGDARAGGDAAAEVELRSHQFCKPLPQTDDFREGLLQHLQRQPPRSACLGRPVGKVEHQLHLLAPAFRPANVGRHPSAEQIDPLRLINEGFGRLGESGTVHLGKPVLASVREQSGDGAIDQGLEGADHLVGGGPARLRLRHGDLLHCVQDFHARGVQLFDQVGPVQ